MHCVVNNDRAQPLKLGLNENSGYTNPVNMNLLKRPYLYFGFLPIAQASNRDEQGVKVYALNCITVVN